MRSWLAGRLAGGVLAVTALALAPSPAAGRRSPLADAVVRVAQEGQKHSARAAVQRILAATPPTDTLYPQILYTQAMVAGSAGEMRRLLQQVTVEFATSSWRTTRCSAWWQMDYATRNYEARREPRAPPARLPGDGAAAAGLLLAARTYFDSNNPSAACRWLADGMARSRDDVQHCRTSSATFYQRCDLRADSGATQAADTARADSGRAAAGPPGAPSPTAASPTASGARRIGCSHPATRRPTSAEHRAASDAGSRGCVGPVARTRHSAHGAPGGPSFASRLPRSRAGRPAEDAARQGPSARLTVRTVEEKGLYKVRLGEYATREAHRTPRPAQTKLGGSPFVVAEPERRACSRARAGRLSAAAARASSRAGL